MLCLPFSRRVSQDSTFVYLKDLSAIGMSFLFAPFAVFRSSGKLLLVSHSYAASAIDGLFYLMLVL